MKYVDSFHEKCMKTSIKCCTALYLDNISKSDEDKTYVNRKVYLDVYKSNIYT